MNDAFFKFDRLEFSGSLADLGTLIPLTLALVVVNGLNVTVVLMMVGLFYLASGYYFRLPLPVQPLKVVAALAVAFPVQITVGVISAAGILMGLALFLIAVTGVIDILARLFSKSVVRGLQLGLGLILIQKGLGFIVDKQLFMAQAMFASPVTAFPLNMALGITAVIAVTFLLSLKRFPAALILVTLGLIVGALFAGPGALAFAVGPEPATVRLPAYGDFSTAFFLLILPQIPLTIGNAVISTRDLCLRYFENDPRTSRVTHKALSLSMAAANLVVGMLGGMPMCHGAGGLAAHYRFGARTGGSNLMIGTLFVILGLFFGKIALLLLSLIPQAVLGTLLLFAGLELALLVRDVKSKNDWFILFMITGIGLATNNMGLAFIAGIILERMMKLARLRL